MESSTPEGTTPKSDSKEEIFFFPWKLAVDIEEGELLKDEEIFFFLLQISLVSFSIFPIFSPRAFEFASGV